MKILLEVFRNTPVGRNCRILSQNVLEVATSNVDKDIEVRFLPLSSPEAEDRGVELAPALVINRRLIIEGVPGPEKIISSIEKALPISLGIILTKAPYDGENAESALEAATKALEMGDKTGLFLLSDGVWVAKKEQQGAIAQKLGQFIQNGGEVIVSSEHLQAGGLSPEALVEKVGIATEPYDRLVELVMEQWDKVIVF